jgi:hypothetical protein
VALFQRYVDDFGLGFRVAQNRTLHMPAYTGTLELPHVARTGA